MIHARRVFCKVHFFACQVHREQGVLHCVGTRLHVAFNKERSPGRDAGFSFMERLFVLAGPFGILLQSTRAQLCNATSPGSSPLRTPDPLPPPPGYPSGGARIQCESRKQLRRLISCPIALVGVEVFGCLRHGTPIAPWAHMAEGWV